MVLHSGTTIYRPKEGYVRFKTERNNEISLTFRLLLPSPFPNFQLLRKPSHFIWTDHDAKKPINLLFEMVFSGNTTCLTFYCEMEKGLGESGRQIAHREKAFVL